MRTVTILKSSSLYRDDFLIKGFAFGFGEKSLCIVGTTRGNEYQQLFVCSQLVRELKKAEERNQLTPGHEILVIPCCNPSSLNVDKRFWPIDNTDINRMFPGYDLGETTQRIAYKIFETVKDYEVGVQLASFYMPGNFLPHVLIMQTEMEYQDLATKFDVPYVVIRKPRPFDTTTLNYNWQIWETMAFSLYTNTTDSLDPVSAARGVRSVLAFMSETGLLRDYPDSTHEYKILYEDEDVLSLRTPSAGFFIPKVRVEDSIAQGQILANIVDPTDGEIIDELVSPCDGTVFFMHSRPLVYSNTSAIKIIKKKAPL